MENKSLAQKMCQSAFGLFVGPTIDPTKVERSKNWVRIFAQVAHNIGEAGYDVSVFSSDRETRLDMPLPDGHQLRIVLNRDAEDAPFIYVRFMPFDSLYFEDIVKPVFSSACELRDFQPYRSQCYSHPITECDETTKEWLNSIAITILNKFISSSSRTSP